MSNKRKAKNPQGHLPASKEANHPPSTSNRITVAEAHFGPIPHPQTLARYDEIVPGSAERILKMAEDEAAHVRQMDRSALDADERIKTRGQRYGMLAIVISFATCIVLSWLGTPAIVATTIGGTTVIGLVVAFVSGRQTSGKE